MPDIEKAVANMSDDAVRELLKEFFWIIANPNETPGPFVKGIRTRRSEQIIAKAKAIMAGHPQPCYQI